MRLVAIAAAALAALTSITAASAKDWTGTTVRIGTDATYPPFESQDASGKIVGFDVDIGMAACEAVQLKCEFSNQDWDGIIPALTAGKIDAILSSMSITDERLKTIDFSDKVYNTPPAIVVPKDSAIASTDFSNFDGKSVGVQSSTTHATFAEKMLKGADIKYYKSADDYKLDLTSGRLDAALDDIVVLSDFLKTADGACCKLLGTLKPILEINGPGTAIGLRKEDTDLKALFNKGLTAIRANGKYKEINDKYFAFDAYGE